MPASGLTTVASTVAPSDQTRPIVPSSADDLKKSSLVFSYRTGIAATSPDSGGGVVGDGPQRSHRQVGFVAGVDHRRERGARVVAAAERMRADRARSDQEQLPAAEAHPGQNSAGGARAHFELFPVLGPVRKPLKNSEARTIG